MDFVDEFRRRPDANMVCHPPAPELDEKLRGLLAGTVEVLCEERGMRCPGWCCATAVLCEAWFVAGTENLKALALVESPVHFRKRRIFVLANFLERA